MILEKKKEKNKKVVMNIEQNTKHLARTKKTDRQIEKKHTHMAQTHENRETEGGCA